MKDKFSSPKARNQDKTNWKKIIEGDQREADRLAESDIENPPMVEKKFKKSEKKS